MKDEFRLALLLASLGFVFAADVGQPSEDSFEQRRRSHRSLDGAGNHRHREQPQSMSRVSAQVHKLIAPYPPSPESAKIPAPARPLHRALLDVPRIPRPATRHQSKSLPF